MVANVVLLLGGGTIKYLKSLVGLYSAWSDGTEIYISLDDILDDLERDKIL